MMQPYQLIVFDWEGTLADSIGQMLQVIEEKAADLGFLPVDKAAMRQGLAAGLLNAIRKGLAHVSHEAHQALFLSVQKALCEKSLMPCMFPGAVDLIRRLDAQGVKLAIATNKGSHSLHQALQKLQLLDYFQITRSAGQVPPKPHPQMLLDILDACSVASDKALMIGDTVSDIEMAVAVSMDAIGVDWYAQGADDLIAAGAKKIVHDYDELAQFLGLSV